MFLTIFSLTNVTHFLLALEILCFCLIYSYVISVCLFVCLSAPPPLRGCRPQNLGLRPPQRLRFCWPEASNNQVCDDPGQFLTGFEGPKALK